MAAEFNEHEGTIHKMVFNRDAQMLVSSGGDGMLGVFDLRKNELYAMSDCLEEDLTSLCLMKHGRKVITSASDGVLNIFSWDWFGDCNDRIVGHPGSVDCMIKYDEDTVLTGCEDGLIRAVSVLPNKIISILGDPLDTEDEVFHIQKLALSHDCKFVASCTLDDIVRIIDVSNLENRIKDDTFDEEEYEQSIKPNLKANHGKVVQEEAKEGESGEDWEEDSDESGDSDSEGGKKKKKSKKNKQLNPKNPTLGASKKMIDDQKRKDFFDGL
jgi:WD40 repeat protein